MTSINSLKIKRTLVENCLNQIKLHPVVLNDYVSHVLPSKSNVSLLDSDVISFEDDKESFNGLKTSIFENNEWKETNASKALKNKHCCTKQEVDLISTLNPERNVYTRKHFKWLLSDDKDSFSEDVNILKANEISFEDFVNKNFFSFENYFGKNTTLNKKLREFCEWAKREFDCSEHEVDPITIMKIFSVNYESDPLMFVQINLEEISDKSLFEKLSPSSVKISKDKQNDLPRKQMHTGNLRQCFRKKSLWGKLKNVSQPDLRLNPKFTKYESVKLFVDYFKAKCNKRVPYSFK
jgi:hypothetical protein